MQRFLIVAGIAAFIALYVLSASTDSASMLADYFWYVVSACAALVLCMFGVVVRYIWLIIRDKSNRVSGSQIARRLSLMFTLVAVLPALFLFGVSAQFISNSINSWFGNDTREALERSLSLSKSALDLAVDNSVGRAAAVQVELISGLGLHSDLAAVLESEAAKEYSQMAVWDLNSGKILAQRNPEHFRQPELDAEIVREVLANGSRQGVENINGRLYARGWLDVSGEDGRKLALFFRQPIPEKVAQDAELIESARAKYAELTFAQNGLQTFFLVTLLIATLLATLLALAAALSFARRFVEPILALAEGAKVVAAGDFSRRLSVQRKDELGRLTEQFNHMTERLAEAKDADIRHSAEQEAARHYLERVLDSLSAGVLTLDAQGCLKTYNASAEAILGIALDGLLGKDWNDFVRESPQYGELAEAVAAILATENSGKAEEIAYAGPDDSRILLGKAIRLPEENGNGVVLVFDDITALVRAQKDAAWGEVAKRLAHEIRNPLTPIQLSAERLAWKLADKLDENDAQILAKSTGTIVKQVASLKEMVEAFRNYARTPALKLADLDLNTLVEEVLVLYEGSSCTFNAELSRIPLFVKADVTAMRQVLHNLLKNAAEAAQAETEEIPAVEIKTVQEKGYVVLSVCNNGKSFSKEMLTKAFEPYVTDKPTGTGLGLPVVKKLIEEHNGRIALANRSKGGACLTVSLPSVLFESDNFESGKHSDHA